MVRLQIDPERYPSGVTQLFNIFFEEELRLVGGCVRDLVLDEQPKDWDMCTPLLPQRVVQILETNGFKPFDLSNGHGTISVIIDGETIEITTLRRDIETDGRHAKVEFVTDYKADALRRDFTFNAMSADKYGDVYDYFNGVQHLTTHELHFVGNPEERITEDYLRILRYFRFAGRFNMQMLIRELNAIKANAFGLQQISGERIWMEMKKIVVDRKADSIIAMMDACGVLEQIGMK